MNDNDGSYIRNALKVSEMTDDIKKHQNKWRNHVLWKRGDIHTQTKGRRDVEAPQIFRQACRASVDGI